MTSDPKLRAVSDPPDEPAEVATQSARRAGPGTWISVALGLLLLLCLVTLVWSRAQLAESGERIGTLEDENRLLHGVIESRDLQIEAQKARLSEVRTSVQGLLSLIDEPVEP